MMRVAVVDGYSTGRLLLAELRRRGIFCIHVRSSPQPPRFARREPPLISDIDIGYHADPAEAAAVLVTHRVQRVVAGSEAGLVLTDLLNHLMGLPGNAVLNAAARRDKVEMARLVAAAGLAVPHGGVFSAADDAVAWYRESGLGEVVVKPSASSGTDNVRFCASDAAVREASESVLGAHNTMDERNTAVLVQERLVGAEYCVNTVSHAGIHRVAELWRYVKRQGPGDSPIYDYDEPVPVGSTVGEAVRAFTFAVLDALGVTDGAGHTEVMVTERGPVLVESAARLGGGTRPEVVRQYLGVAQTTLLVDTIIDQAGLSRFNDRAVRQTGHLRHVELINNHAGHVRSLAWVQRLEQLGTATEVVTVVKPSAYLPVTADLATSPGYLYLGAADQADLLRDYERLRAMEAEPIYTG